MTTIPRNNPFTPISVSEFHDSPLFRFLNEVPEDEQGHPTPLPGLPQSGFPEDPTAPALGFINGEYGVPLILGFLRAHDDDGSPSEPSERKISLYEHNLLYSILTDPVLRGMADPTGLDRIRRLLGLAETTESGPGVDTSPSVPGRLNLPDQRVSIVGEAQLRSMDGLQLASLFEREIRVRRPEFLNPMAGSAEVRSAKLLGLLRDYAEALWASGQTPMSRKASEKMLDVLEKQTDGVAMILGKRDYTGLGFGAAQRIALGGDPNEFDFRLPHARLARKTTYLSMSSVMVESAELVDEVREIMGLEPKAVQKELASPLDFVVGLESGHRKVSSFAQESRAIRSTGIRWAHVLFPGDEEIRDLPAASDFDIAIDFLDDFGSFVRCDPAAGERLVVEHADGATPIRVEKVVVRDQEGHAIRWSAKFFHSETGEQIAPSDVRGRFYDAEGQPKSNGEVGGEIGLGWWGFCDLNTFQAIIKAQWDLQELDADTIPTQWGVSFDRSSAQKILDANLNRVAQKHLFWNFRFDDEPQIIILRNGRKIEGRVSDQVFANQPGGSRTHDDYFGDRILLHNTPEKRLMGFLEIAVGDGARQKVLVRDIASVLLLDRDTKSIKITLKDHPEGASITGLLQDELPWEEAETADTGEPVWVQDQRGPIRGYVDVDLSNGGSERINAGDIQMIAGESKSENDFAVHLTMVERVMGIYGQDTARSEMVANSPQYINGIDPVVSEDGTPPSWWASNQAPAEGKLGPVVLGPRDHIVYYRGWQASQPGGPPVRDVFTGWVQVDEANGRIVNEGFSKGQPDFAFGTLPDQEWVNIRTSFNPHIDPAVQEGLLVQLLVNGTNMLRRVEDGADLYALRIGLPSNWADSIVSEGEGLPPGTRRRH